MKRLSKLAAILAALVLACAFFGCSDGNSSDEISSVGNSSADESNDQSNGNSSDDESNDQSNGNSSDDESSDDESNDQSITLSDGNYTLKIKQSDYGMVEEYDFKATASNESWTFKSGSKTQTVDLKKQMSATSLAAFNAMNEDDKKAMAKENMNFPDDAEIIFADNKVIVKSTLSGAELTEMQEKYQLSLSSIPSDAKIETITDKTEYKITRSKKGKTIVFYINKD